MDTDDTTMTAPPMAPDHEDLLGFSTPEHVEFSRDASVTLAGQKAQSWQEVEHENRVQPALYVSRAPVIVDLSPAISPTVEPVNEPHKPKRRGPGRPKKRGPKKTKGQDKRVRVMAGPITQVGRRDMLESVQFARHKWRELDTTVNFQPVHLDTYPEGEDMGRWFRNGIVRDIATFFARSKDSKGKPLRWWGFATRENYEGERREHLHIVLWCPPQLREKLLVFLRRRYPGGTAKGRMAVHVGPLIDRDGVDGIEYRLKQAEGNAAGPPRPGRPVAEVKSRHDGAPVTAVYGKRYIISQTLARPARSKDGWQMHQDVARRERSIISRAQRAAMRPTIIPSTSIISPAGIV